VCRVFVSSVVDRGSSPDRVTPKTNQLVFVILSKARSTKEKEQRLVGSESG